MFCGKCGRQLDENKTTCAFCGHNNTIGEKKAKATIKIRIKHIIVFVLIFICCFYGIKTIINKTGIHSSPEKVVTAMYEAEKEIDMDKLMKCYPDFIIKEFALEYGLDENASRKEVGNKYIKQFRFLSPEEPDISSVTAFEPITASEDIFYEVSNYECATFDDISKITEMVEVRIKYWRDASYSYDFNDYWTIKVDGKWYVLP